MPDDDPVAACERGAISPQVALARLLLAGLSDSDLDQAARPGTALAALIDTQRARLPALRALAADVDHARPIGVADVAALFDRAVAAGPEASVAFYSLGDPARLDAATQELVRWLARLGLARGDIVDLGCGIGRVGAALAARGCRVLGLDVSPGMVAEARRRHPSLRFAVTAGDGLDLPPGSHDLVLAIDVFPYLLQAGADLLARHVADAARVLRPAGALVVCNWSYRNDAAADAAEAAALAIRHGLQPEILGSRPFSIWDGTAFVLRRP